MFRAGLVGDAPRAKPKRGRKTILRDLPDTRLHPKVPPKAGMGFGEVWTRKLVQTLAKTYLGYPRDRFFEHVSGPKFPEPYQNPISKNPVEYPCFPLRRPLKARGPGWGGGLAAFLSGASMWPGHACATLIHWCRDSDTGAQWLRATASNLCAIDPASRPIRKPVLGLIFSHDSWTCSTRGSRTKQV